MNNESTFSYLENMREWCAAHPKALQAISQSMTTYDEFWPWLHFYTTEGKQNYYQFKVNPTKVQVFVMTPLSLSYICITSNYIKAWHIIITVIHVPGLSCA